MITKLIFTLSFPFPGGIRAKLNKKIGSRCTFPTPRPPPAPGATRRRRGKSSGGADWPRKSMQSKNIKLTGEEKGNEKRERESENAK